MIISASRRTDLPAAHADWLMERFRAGFVLVRNPMNPRAVSRVSLRPEDVDGIVFWTKNPIPMLGRLDELGEMPYYFQYTLTGYGRDVEENLPPQEARLEAFAQLSERLGANRVLWRYDPILLSRSYPVDGHLSEFERLANRLKGRTRRVTISFVDTYARNKGRLAQIGAEPIFEETMRSMASEMARIARANGMEPVACCEKLDLTECGVSAASCVDARLLGEIGGVPLRTKKDSNQREHCGCAPSVDIGAYNTCPNGCAYCYANYSPALLARNLAGRDDRSPMLCDRLGEGDRLSERRAESLKERQLRMEI